MPSYSALLESYARQVFTSRSSNLPPSLASRVRADLFRLQRMSLPPQGTCELFGYTITYLGEGELRFLSQEIFGWGAYMFKSHSREPVIFDCGSNIGMSVLFFKALYPHARITAFEPDPGTYKVLNRNIEQNSLSAVSTHQIALAANDGGIEFFRDEDDCSSSLLMSTNRDRHSGKTIRVPSRRLSAFIDSDIDLLKLDVEGAELEILHEIEAANKFRFIHRIHLEYHHHIGNAPDSMSSILRLLEGNGFGYQISASQGLDWPKEKAFQDISLYCYRR